MIVSLQWLRHYVPIPDDLSLLEKTLTDIGLEVEAIESTGGEFSDVVVALVETCIKHPDAKKLSVCTVYDGTERHTVVCGAPNVAEGQKVAFARVGCELPKLGLTITRRMLRGVESAGMICATDELGLGEDHSGIIVLPADAEIGLSYREFLGPQDTRIQIGITPNRGDALSHVGVARDIAASYRLPLSIPEPTVNASDSAPVTLEIQDPEGCPRYSAALLRGIRVTSSPDWLKKALESVGMRSINNIVDVTNFVMLEIGQPLHAFDFQTLEGGGVLVRQAVEGESFITLDGKSHILPSGAVLICDLQKPVAIAGVMGGQNSEVTDKTTDILLESAHFHPSRIRATARRLGISSEAGFRFERGTDPDRTLWALRRAVELILSTCNGEYCGLVDACPVQPLRPQIPLDPNRVNALLGITVERGEQIRILRDLGFQIQENDDLLSCLPPGYRSDCSRPIDLVEEIARIHGYDNIPTPDSITLPAQLQRDDEAFSSRIRSIALGLGLDEIMSSSLVSRDHHPDETKNEIIEVLNPVSQDRPTLRTHLIVSLLEAIDINQRNGIASIAIFENGKSYLKDAMGAFSEREHWACALTGLAQERSWHSQERDFDVFDIKGIAEAILRKLGLDNRFAFSYDGQDSLFHYRLRIHEGEITIGYLGEIDEVFKRKFGVEQRVLACDLDLDTLRSVPMPKKRYQAVPRYPVVKRDLAFLVEDVVTAETMDAVIHKSGCIHLASSQIVDVFQHESLGPGKKSMMVSCQFQSAERTLQEQDIQKDISAIISAVEQQLHASLRSSH